MATSKQNPTYLRVLQHDRSDEIRIGVAFCAIGELDKAEQECVKTYEEKCAWCGGFSAACEKYYKRIALVDAETLETVRTIYEDNCVEIDNMADLTEYLNDYSIRYPGTYTTLTDIKRTLFKGYQSRKKEDLDLDFHIAVCSDWENTVYLFTYHGASFGKIYFKFEEIVKY